MLLIAAWPCYIIHGSIDGGGVVNRIKELRLQHGWRQEDLALKMSTKRQTVARYETGERGLDVETILRLCDIFDCTADYLLGRSSTGGLQLTPEEENIILALRRADDRAIEMVHVALAPFKKDALSVKATTTA